MAVAVQVVVWLLAVVVQVTVEQGSPLAPVVVVVAHRASRLATWYARTCWHLAGEESTRWCVVRAGSPAKPYEVVLKLDAKRPSDACLTLGGRPVEFHLARHSAGRPDRLHRQRAPWPEGVTVGSPSAVPRHPTATRTDTSSRREHGSRCAPRNVWLVVRIAQRRERRQAGGGGGGGSQEADGRWQVAATPGGMGGLRGSGAKSARHGPPLKGIAAPSEPPGGLWGACGGGRRPTSYSPRCEPLSG